MSTKAGIHARVIGLRTVANNVNIAIARIKGVTMAGLIEAMAHIRYDMDKTPPLIPIGKTGALRGSWRTEGIETSKGPTVMGGFGGTPESGYAVYVHEMTVPPYTKPIDWSRPGSGPKFLEESVKRNAGEVLNIIVRNVRTVT